MNHAATLELERSLRLLADNIPDEYEGKISVHTSNQVVDQSMLLAWAKILDDVRISHSGATSWMSGSIGVINVHVTYKCGLLGEQPPVQVRKPDDAESLETLNLLLAERGVA